MRLSFRIFRFTAVVWAGTILAFAPSPEKDKQSGKQSGIQSSYVSKKVSVAQVSLSEVAGEQRYSGVLKASRRAGLTFTVAGRMLERPVRTGDQVAQDQIIAKLDDAPFAHAEAAAEARLAEVEANLAQARRDVNRLEKLVGAKAATDEELEKNRAALKAYEAGLNAARTALDEAVRQRREAVLRAPFAGTVTQVMLEPGEFASAGAAVVSVSGLDSLEMEVQIPESAIIGLRQGAEVRIVLPLSEGREIKGRIRSLGQSSGAAGQLFPVMVDIAPEPGLLSGMTAELLLAPAQSHALVVPLSAVVNPSGNAPRVFRLVQDVVQIVPVEVRGLIGEQVVIMGELAPGDRVVVDGVAGLIDGQRVEVQ